MSKYDEAVTAIKTAILKSQYDAARTVNEKQLVLYFSIGKYISWNSRDGFWGTGAIDSISNQLEKELPGLRGFSARNLRYMRKFYEEWSMIDNFFVKNEIISNSNLAPAGAKFELVFNEALDPVRINNESFPVADFFGIGFSHHRIIITKVGDVNARLYYIRKCYAERLSREELEKSINRDDYRHCSMLPNNFSQTLPSENQALKAISVFKDEYLLDFINVEEIEARNRMDVNERVVENSIINNVKKFILTFGRDFAFVQNQYHLKSFGEDQYVDLLFFNRALNCLVAVELKTGRFKTSYLGQLQGYLSILDGFEKKPHENPSIGLILCKDMNKSFVDYVIKDYSKPMGVATYITSESMTEEFKKALPDINDLRRLLDS